jgi:hypothetical protein
MLRVLYQYSNERGQREGEVFFTRRYVGHLSEAKIACPMSVFE